MAQNEGHVLTCTKTDCAYNQDEICYAPGIEVGDMHPTCDTYTTSGGQPSQEPMADVSTCNVTECQFNTNKDCMAPGITVADHSGHADCFTYRSS
ncbi:MAG: DUF1540 domain-containing protein [Candidatus Aquicultorales bacterium]